MTRAASIDDWVARYSTPFSPDVPGSLHTAVAALLSSLDPGIEILALGEALHGGEAILRLRNRLFQHLVESHGFTAIAIESSYPRSHRVNAYVHPHAGPTSYDDVAEAGFSHGFGRLDTTRELVEWVRSYNATHPVHIRFFGFDSPTEMTSADSPHVLLGLALDYFASIDPSAVRSHRSQVDAFLGDDATWENPAASFDHTQSIGRSASAASLRLATEDLLSDLQLRRPELIERSDAGGFADAVHHVISARHLLNYHAELAANAPDRIARLLGIRDVMMADNLLHLAARERARGGRLFAFAHNTHLQRGRALWQWGPNTLQWWPAGAHVAATLGPRYANIATALAMSPDNGIPSAEPDTLEHHLARAPGPVRFVPTAPARHLDLSHVPKRSPGRNPTFFPLTPQFLPDFDYVLTLDTSTYTRGGPPLPSA